MEGRADLDLRDGVCLCLEDLPGKFGLCLIGVG